MIYAVCFFVCAFLISLALTPQAIRLGQRGIGLDKPNESRKKHGQPIPRIGGIPIMIALTIAAVVILLIDRGRTRQWLPVFFGCGLMFGVGLWDDFKSLGAKRKLAAQVTTE